MLLVEVREDATLKNLDKFLREIWLECCGHLSSFRINGVNYDVIHMDKMGWGLPSKTMNYKLKDVLDVSMKIQYEYDFGSTTTLTLKVFDYREGYWQKDKVSIMSRNNPVQEVCDECGEEVATVTCVEDQVLLCDKCKDDHDCGEEMQLKLVNSPRSGVCAYEGSEKYPDVLERITIYK